MTEYENCYLIKWSDITQKLNVLKHRFFVYLLLDKDKVVYVGRTFNLSCRLSNHKYRKQFDEVILLEFDNYEDSCLHEKILTLKYKPMLNKLWVSYGFRK